LDSILKDKQPVLEMYFGVGGYEKKGEVAGDLNF
jgi:hypothetical protein